MRLVTWNCRGAFRKKHTFARALRPDILIVPECEQAFGLQQTLDGPAIRSFEWFGRNRNKGLAVLSYGDYVLDLHPSYASHHQWVVPLIVSGPVAFVLVAVWTLPLGSQGGRYVRPLFEAFESYKTLLTGSEVVWAGDFNANYVWDRPSRRYKFRDFVTLLSQNGLHSLYHDRRNCQHGAEPDATFYLYHHLERAYHIDYVFARDTFHPHGVEVSLGAYSDWSEHSDHVPLVCDFAGAPSKRAGRPPAT